MSSYDCAGYGIFFNFLGAKQETNDDTAECGGCTYWDGATCMNPQSRSYGRETDDGCEVKEGEDRAD